MQGVRVGSTLDKINLAIEETMKAPKGSRWIALLLSLTSPLDGIGWPTPRPGSFTSGKDPVSAV